MSDKKSASDQSWDKFFLEQAWHAATKSKDPSTKVGAVIAKGKDFISLGFNGFPRGVQDLPERYADRDWKYPAVLHAELNAVLFARRDLTGCTVYVWPMPCCARCTAVLIQSGITRVVSGRATPEQRLRWSIDFKVAREMVGDPGVNLTVEEMDLDPVRVVLPDYVDEED